MNEPWGYQEANSYISKKSAVEDDLAESKKNDEQELKDIEELKKSKVDNVSYDKNENKIVFFANKKEIASIDTTDFVKDGMIESVELDGTVLKIIFNTESGKEEIDVDFKDIISGDSFYTKDEVDSKLDEKANKSDIPSMDEYAKTADVQTEIANAVSGKADSSDVEAIEAQITPISSDIATLKLKDDELQEAIGLKASQADFEALSSNVYTKQESDERFLTEHQSLSGYATEAWVGEQGFLTEHQDISSLATKEEVSQLNEKIEGIDLTPYATIEDTNAKLELKADKEVTYTKEQVDAIVAEKQTEIDKIISDYKKLKEIVGDLGGDVEYSVPADGKLTDLLKKSGIIKLTEDVESNTYTGGITSKNITTLNLNGKTITTTANTTTNPSIMARGTQQFTVQGSGTSNANGHIAIEANGEDAVITLGGTSFGKPTYVTNREGELIYCYLGTINITNGVFRNDNENKKFLLNCYDANYRNGTAKIVVTGGKFYDFDPANNTSEGEGTSYVPEGYTSVESTETIDGVEHTVYTVKKV